MKIPNEELVADPKYTVTCSSCGKLDFVYPHPTEVPDSEGYYCQDCIAGWTRDPLTDQEKQALAEPLHIAQIRKIYKEKTAAGVKCPKLGKRLLMDLFSASIIIQVYDALNDENREKVSKLSISHLQRVALRVCGKVS